MKRTLLCASALALGAGSAMAGGLDRSGQSVLAIFDANNTTSVSFGHVMPSVTGEDAAGNDYDVGEDYQQYGFSYTNQINEQFNYSLIFDQPYGADVDYNNNPATSALGGTFADLNSRALTFVGRYKVTDRFSVFAGIKAEQVNAEVGLNGTAYRTPIALGAAAATANNTFGTSNITPQLLGANAGLAGAAAQAQAAGVLDSFLPPVPVGGGATAPASAVLANQTNGALTNFFPTGGYRFEMEDDTKPGYLIGAAYEIPDIALRFAATYHFEIEHKADTTERLLGQTIRDEVEYVTPQSLNLEFQTGIAEGTLLTAGYRWTEFSAVDVVPTALGADLVNLEDSHRYTLGVGRQFNDKFAGSITLIYEPEGDGDTVSPLGPTDGQFGVTLGMRYVNGPFNISGGINYTKLGDADAGVQDVAVASFEDNSVVGIGFKAQMNF